MLGISAELCVELVTGIFVVNETGAFGITNESERFRLIFRTLLYLQATRRIRHFLLLSVTAKYNIASFGFSI